jgi:hypothetical protein
MKGFHLTANCIIPKFISDFLYNLILVKNPCFRNNLCKKEEGNCAAWQLGTWNVLSKAQHFSGQRRGCVPVRGRTFLPVHTYPKYSISIN